MAAAPTHPCRNLERPGGRRARQKTQRKETRLPSSSTRSGLMLAFPDPSSSHPFAPCVELAHPNHQYVVALVPAVP